MKLDQIKLTQRDLDILTFINIFGFVEMPQLDKRFGLKKPRNYQVINRLVKNDLVKHERIFYGRHGIYRLSRKGEKFTGLPALSRISLANYHHDVTTIEVYLKLLARYPEAKWSSVRQLMQDKYADGVGKRGHLPDGLLVFPDGKKIAIEVELTLKGKNRLERILRVYKATFSLEGVWYYCSDNVAASMGPMVAKMPFIKIYRVQELLYGK